MASRVQPPQEQPNFKRPRKDRVHKQSNAREERPGMSAAHCTAIRSLPCAACFKMPCGEIHHLKKDTGQRGMGLRATDRFGVPLCRVHHEEIERAGTKNEAAVFSSWGIADVQELAAGLWAASPDASKMLAVLIANRLGRASS